MAILVSNPSTTSLMGLSADPADAALAAPEAGFTEELAVAMRPPSPASDPGADALLAGHDPADDKSLDLQILPPDVLLNAVGDANFALAAPAALPAVAVDVPADDAGTLTIGDPVEAAELAAAALAAQGVQALPTVQPTNAVAQAVSALAGPERALSSAGAGAPISAGGWADTQQAQAAQMLQSNGLEVPVAEVGVPSGVVLTTPAIEAMPAAAAQVSMPSSQDLARLAQGQALDQSSAQTKTVVQAATLAPVDPQAGVSPLSVQDRAAQDAASEAVQVLAGVPHQPTAAPLDPAAAPVVTLPTSGATVEVVQNTVPVATSALPTPVSEQSGTATVQTKAVEAAAPQWVATGASSPAQAAENDRRGDSPTVSGLSSEGMSADAAQTQAASGSATLAGGAVPTESAFQFDAKLGNADAAADAGVSRVADVGAASLASGVALTLRAGRTGMERQEMDPEVAAAREERGMLAAAMQTTTSVASSEKASAAPAKGFDEISSTFVSSLVGGAQRPVTTVMDWVSLQPQARPAAVEPHEVRLDTGAVQVEIQRMVKQGGGQVVMELTPPDQSKFTIELKLDERGGAHLVVEGISDSTRTRLEQSAPQLHEQFQQMGLNLQLDMRQHRESASSGAQERAPNDFSAGASAPEPTVQASRAAAASRAREAGSSQVYLYA